MDLCSNYSRKALSELGRSVICRQQSEGLLDIGYKEGANPPPFLILMPFTSRAYVSAPEIRIVLFRQQEMVSMRERIRKWWNRFALAVVAMFTVAGVAVNAAATDSTAGMTEIVNLMWVIIPLMFVVGLITGLMAAMRGMFS